MPPRKKPTTVDPVEKMSSVEDLSGLSAIQQSLVLSKALITKKFGDVNQMRYEMDSLSQPLVPIADLGHQWALKAPGYRGGRIVVLAAEPGASKSSAALALCEITRAAGGLAEYIDLEEALNEDHLSYYLTDPDEFAQHIHTPYTIEDGIELFRTLLQAFQKVDPERKLPKVIVFDSIGGAPSKAELDPDKEIAQMRVGGVSGYLTPAARAIKHQLKLAGTVGVFINHSKEKIFTGYEALVPRKQEDKMTYPGGKSFIYQSSYFEYLKRGSDVKDADKARAGFGVSSTFFRNRGRPNGRSYGYDVIYEAAPGESIRYVPHTMDFLSLGEVLGLKVKSKRYWCPEIGVKETDKLNDEEMYALIHHTPEIKARFQAALEISDRPDDEPGGADEAAE